MQIYHTCFTTKLALGATFAINSAFGADIPNILGKELLQGFIKQQVPKF